MHKVAGDYHQVGLAGDHRVGGAREGCQIMLVAAFAPPGQIAQCAFANQREGWRAVQTAGMNIG